MADSIWRELLRSPPRTLAEASVRQRLSVLVPADDTAFAARKGTLKLALRTARRALLLQASGQLRTLHSRLAPEWRRLLWIHEGMPQIGDALMDLAPRSLLVERGIHVDLYAGRHIAELFEHDTWFGRSLWRAEDVHAADYDAAIVLSHDRKALRLKRTRLAVLPWVSLQGFYGGPDFHRARFATTRLADLLGLALTNGEHARHSAQKLPLSATAVARAAALWRTAPGPSIALALGGVWPQRTYHRWHEVLALLSERGWHGRVVLLGSANGRELADRLAGDVPHGLELLDLIGRTTLPEAQALIARCSAAACADGGLMHLAFATGVPVVALFNAAIDPQWRVPAAMKGVALASAGEEVDGIAPSAVADAIENALASDDGSHTLPHELTATRR
ncbi:MAG TPA: glycosyltransferase family 9 protein [Burkholderiaceae bacterium]|nr:glycosyltransferase family 9 protein [Burkholderiaceae bacterium]